MEEQAINEIKINFNTEEGQAVFESDKLTGKLSGLIVESSDTISIIVKSSIGYNIFQKSTHIGTRYYAPRAVMQGVSQNLNVSDQFSKYLINEPIEIIIRGPKNKNVTVILRFE